MFQNGVTFDPTGLTSMNKRGTGPLPPALDPHYFIHPLESTSNLFVLDSAYCPIPINSKQLQLHIVGKGLTLIMGTPLLL